MILVLIFSLVTACANKPAGPIEEEHVYGKIIYVSPDGNDENSGEKGSPVASLSGAVKALRVYRAENGLPKGGIKIEFALGTYNVTEGITLTAEDSGTEESPIVFAGADGANVLFNGGVILDPSDFKPADDAFNSLLQTEEAKENVLMIDLTKTGCYDLENKDIYPEQGFTEEFFDDYHAYRQELFVNGKRQTVARWPNSGYIHPEVDTKNTVSDTNGKKYGKIFIAEEQSAVWRNTDNIRFYGYPYFDYKAVFLNKISVSDDEAALLYPMTDGSENLRSTCLYYVSNIPQELDAPGEYYWDTKTNILYYWPDTDLSASEIYISQFTETPFTFSDCSYITFDNLSAQYLRNGFINGSGDHVTVSNCCISDIAGLAAINLSGDYITVKGCLLHDLATKGIRVTSGDIPTQTMGNTVITDNIIYEWQQVYTLYNAAIDINGMGFLVSHNELYDSPHVAVEVAAGQCIIEYNSIYNCCKECSDCAAIHTMGHSFLWGENIYRYNALHDIKDIIREDGWGNAIYFDCWGRFCEAYGNLFYNIGGTALCGACGYMSYHDNIFLNVGEPMNISYWGPEEHPDFYDEYRLTNGLRTVDYLGALWRYASPRTALFAEVANQQDNQTSYDLPLSPSHFYVRNNVRYIDLSSSFKPYDEAKEDPYMFHMIRGVQWVFDLCAITDNVCYWEDPGFTDYANGDYTLREDSRVFRDLIGFEEPDLSTVGVRASENPFKQ